MISFNLPLLYTAQPRFAGSDKPRKTQESQEATSLKSALHADQWSRRHGTRSETRPEKQKMNINQPEQGEVGDKASPVRRAMGKMGMLSLEERRNMHQADTDRKPTSGFEFESSDEFDSGDSDEREGYVTLPKSRRSSTYTYSDYRRNEQSQAWRAVLAFQESRRAELAKKESPSGASKSALGPEPK